jgi:transcriptional regulator with XRE-family HTH domain
MILDHKAIGERIAKRRKVLNLTQDEVAERAGLTPTHVWNIEKAHTKCSLEALCKFCEALEVNPDYLFLGALKPADEDLLASVVANLQLCDKKQLKLAAALITCVVDETTP